MTIVRVGTNKKYSEGWETAFGRGTKSNKTTSAVKRGSGAKRAAKKSAKKKSRAPKAKKAKK